VVRIRGAPRVLSIGVIAAPSLTSSSRILGSSSIDVYTPFISVNYEKSTVLFTASLLSYRCATNYDNDVVPNDL